MEVLFLGTGAADYSPRLKTDLKGRFDRDIRRSNAVLLDGHTLIDCGDWILEELAIAGIAPQDIRQVLVSHSHNDHFRADHLCTLAAQAGHPITVYGSADTLRQLAERSPGLPGAEQLHPVRLQVLPMPQPVTFDGFTVTPLRSNHETEQPGEETLHFLVEKAGRTLFYGTDGAWLPTATGKYLYGRQLNCYLFDATCGDYENEYRIFEHNTLPMIRLMLTVLRQQNAFAPDAQLYLVHLAPSLHKSHAETAALAARDGLLVAYDGLRITV